MEDRATLYDMKLNDGTEVQMTLAFGRLYKLRQRRPEAYGKYNEIAMNGMKDELDFVSYLYAAYLCANIDNLAQCMGEEEFLEKLPENHVEVVLMANRLKVGNMKKKQDSVPRS